MHYGHGRQSAVCPYADLSEDLYRAFPLVTVALVLAFRFAKLDVL